MKKTIIILLVLLPTINIIGQITHEASYGTPNNWDQLFTTNLAVSGHKYVKVDNSNNQLILYNLNHSIFKTITIPPQTFFYTGLYVSETLFDADALIEYALGNPSDASGNPHSLRIYNENGILLFSADTVDIVEIKNTSSGTKMITKNHMNFTYDVYSLQGTLLKVNQNIIKSGETISDSYPNPASNYTKVDYSLPKDVSHGEIVVYNLNGKQVKVFKVDKSFNNLIIDTSTLPSGNYLYRLITSKGSSEGKKLIVTK